MSICLQPDYFVPLKAIYAIRGLEITRQWRLQDSLDQNSAARSLTTGLFGSEVCGAQINRSASCVACHAAADES